MGGMRDTKMLRFLDLEYRYLIRHELIPLTNPFTTSLSLSD